MKKLLFISIVISCICLLFGCGGSEQKSTATDTATVENTKLQNQEKSNKHLAFMDSAMINKLKDNKERYDKFRSEFDIVPTKKFTEFYNNFKSMFGIGTTNAPIQNLKELPFSIYGKYQGFQQVLQLRDPTFSNLSTSKSYTNFIRIYPAIDTNKSFYLVFMRELAAIPNASSSSSDTTTDRSVYYSIKYNAIGTANFPFTAIDAAYMKNAEADIKRFQKTLADSADANTGLTFRKEKSFAYSIESYDKLLGGYPYWDMNAEKTDPKSNVVVKIFPGIDKDDTGDVRFRLMVKLYRFVAGNYTEITGKPVFDNMDVCPEKCPTNEIK